MQVVVMDNTTKLYKNIITTNIYISNIMECKYEIYTKVILSDYVSLLEFDPYDWVKNVL